VGVCDGFALLPILVGFEGQTADQRRPTDFCTGANQFAGIARQERGQKAACDCAFGQGGLALPCGAGFASDLACGLAGSEIFDAAQKAVEKGFDHGAPYMLRQVRDGVPRAGPQAGSGAPAAFRAKEKSGRKPAAPVLT
jgi:hypothetical protein